MGVGNKRTITKTRRKTRHLAQFKDTKAAEDLPGLGRHYCIECAKWFDRESTLNSHRRGKPHKRRVKQLGEEPSPDPQRMPGADAEPQIDNRHDNVEEDASGDMEMAT
ncbi:C2H2 finger domain-containing protein [Metarhizium acridum CQMa 102]|uniref:C2H2 finger domain-containing protein n=1 Tax=Metarhizium acridum (strain CQMa 102) TaxID=655827 RepID=E9DVN2_METAQ|nr:C2H2 finger domain-containing protein [Metarhizium acridum CQMa 102]EFY92409.1 C2H2 finger domain-containing protein [Metarhizium acridum CQMa 102]